MTIYTPSSLRIYLGFVRVDPSNDVSRIINDLTGGLGFIHTYNWLPDFGVCWEAHLKFGVKFRRRTPSPSDLLLVYPELTDAKAKLMIQGMMEIDGADYDLFGAYASGDGLLHELFRQDDGKFFCSEAVVYAGKRAGYFNEVVSGKDSPNEIYPKDWWSYHDGIESPV